MNLINLYPNFCTIATFNTGHKIELASNMLEVNTMLNDAWVDFYDIRNLAILKIRMKERGCERFFDQIKETRVEDAKAGKRAFYQHMMYFIPERMHTSLMYKELSEKYA